MRIIPVLDILNSVVVHAVAGEREHYSALKTILTKDSSFGSEYFQGGNYVCC